MAAEVRRLWSRPDRIRGDQNEALRTALLPFIDGDGFEVPAPEVRATALKMMAVADARTAAKHGEEFLMLYPFQNELVVNHLAARSKRKLVALRLWALVLSHLRRDTGEVSLSRGEMAEMLGVPPRHVSQVVGELDDFGALSRVRDGRGVRYFVNPRVGTHLPNKLRGEAQRVAPKLGLVGGADRPSERRRRAVIPAAVL